MAYHCAPALKREAAGERHAVTVGGQKMRESLRLAELEQDIKQLRTVMERLIALVDPEDLRAALELDRITPSNDKLRLIAKRSRPPLHLLNSDEQ